MPRSARERSGSGYYHILIRGIGQQNIFGDDEDREQFINTLKKYKEEMKFEIHAYCLMGNHVHMLMKDNEGKLDLIMKKIECSYAYYYNRKYERVGHLFQDRFKSEAIENDSYYLAVLRYIHQNPLKAGISHAEDYKWSSYSEYVSSKIITDTEFALELLGGMEKYIEYMSGSEEISCLEVSDKIRSTDEEAIEIIKKKCNVKSAQAVQEFTVEKRNKALRKLKEEGLSTRQISRLTGINRGVVLKA